MVWIIPFGVYLYLQYHSYLPQSLQVPYNLYASFKDPSLAFPGGLIWIAIGFHLSNNKIVAWIAHVNNRYFWLASLLCLVLSILGFLPIFGLIICVTLLFMAAYSWKLPDLNPSFYKRLRAYSILFYVIHDSFKKIPKQLFGWENGPLLYVVTLLFCFLASEFIIRMKDVRGFHWLKYAY